MSYYQAFILMCVLENLVSDQNTFTFHENATHCEKRSTLPGYGIVMTNGAPSHDNGTVVITTSLNRTLRSGNPMCTWTYRIRKVNITKKGPPLANGSIFSDWVFSRAGLHKLSVTAVFNYKRKQITIKNCTYINVTDCYQEPKVTVLTSTGSYNISQNHTDVTIYCPGLINFTLSIFTIDPYFICKHLYFLWEFGDGRNASGSPVDHYYNKTGVYLVVLNIFKNIDRTKFVRNITLKVHVKEKHVPTEGTNTVVDVSLVLTIFFVCFVFALCVAAYWFRRRRHRHTEVARFDFRGSEFQSSYDEHRSLHPKRIGCLNSMTCRRGSNEHLLSFPQNGYYSSFRRFGGTDPNEEL